MWRIGRWVFNIAAALSLAACILICVTLGFAIRSMNRVMPLPLSNRLNHLYLGLGLDAGPKVSAAQAIEISMLLPVIWVALRIRRSLRRENQPGHCQQCGYDLTGNVSGICPECGTVFCKPIE